MFFPISTGLLTPKMHGYLFVKLVDTFSKNPGYKNQKARISEILRIF